MTSANSGPRRSGSAQAGPEPGTLSAVPVAGVAATPATETPARKPAEPIDMLQMLQAAGASSATRLGGLAFASVLVLLFALLLRRRSARPAP
ncbi:hypothetical protein ACIHAX_13160 [Nocardia sp. NPDC051929]|uniref:hypothetical protein n=1 Tax=Nocardia sp. NPDC051929 TaxID=3364327 RepID=UPI0037C5C6F2